MENVNLEKRKKFMEVAEKRTNNIIHNIEILNSMSRSNNYDYLKDDVESMFSAIQETLNKTKNELLSRFEKNEKKSFSFSNNEKLNNNENEDEL